MPRASASTAPSPLATADERAAVIERLRRRMAGDTPLDDAKDDPAVGRSPFLRLLGDVGPQRLIDLLEVRPGGGGALVGLRLATLAARRRGELVVIDPHANFYPPAAIAWGVEARRLLLVRPASARDALAAVEIALRSPAVSAVWAALGKIDGRAYRRLLLAAEAGNACGVFVRSHRHEGDPSWADVQLLVEPLAVRSEPDAPLMVRVARRRNRHGPAGGEATLAMDWRTGDLRDLTHTNAFTASNPLSLAAGLAGAAQPA